jgi:RNA-directed DNA polymerase
VTTSTALMTPTGGDGAAAGATRALNQDEVSYVTPDLLDAVLARDNLWRAWKRVKANRGAPGIDGVRLEDFPAYARNHWLDVREQIEQGRYAPQPVRRVAIPKPDGGERLLGIPTILDRVIQQAIAQVLTPIFEPTFSASSFGFRPGPQRTPGDPAGRDLRQGGLSHRGRPGPGQVLRYGRS